MQLLLILPPSLLPPLADSIADLAAEPPTYLFIQMQLCQKESLKDWLRSTITNRPHSKVMSFFNQVRERERKKREDCL